MRTLARPVLLVLSIARSYATSIARSKAWPVAAVLVAALGSTRANAQDKTLSGTWSASSLKETWSTSDWGEDCGPKPTSSGGAPGGTATITQSGSELSFSGPGRAFSTTECWEQMPGLKRTSHSGGSRGWSNRCASPAGDPRRVTVSNTTSATDEFITFVETGIFEWKIKDSTCKASVSRSRSYKLVQRAGEAPAEKPVPTAAPTAQPAAEPAPAAKDCKAPGPPARVEARPARKLLRPGESYKPAVRAADENGCALQPSYELRLPEGSALAAHLELREGAVHAKPDAQSGSSKLEVLTAGRTLTIELEIASPEEYAALLEERGLNDRGEDDRAASIVLDTGIGGKTTKASDGARDRRLTFAAVVLGVALLLGLAALILVRRGRRASDPDEAPESRAAPSNVSLFEAEAATFACPSCGRMYTKLQGFCEDDGTPLVPSIAPPAAAVVVRAPSQPVPRDKICPSCGERFSADAEFCGADGTTLVPIN